MSSEDRYKIKATVLMAILIGADTCHARENVQPCTLARMFATQAHIHALAKPRRSTASRCEEPGVSALVGTLLGKLFQRAWASDSSRGAASTVPSRRGASLEVAPSSRLDQTSLGKSASRIDRFSSRGLVRPVPGAGSIQRRNAPRGRAETSVRDTDRKTLERLPSQERKKPSQLLSERDDGGAKGPSPGDTALEELVLRTFGVSGVFMFIWVFLFFPGSAYTGFEAHDDAIEWLFDRIPLFSLIAPASLITKYNELGHLPALTHAVPGGIWSILATVQLFPDARDRLGRKGHKIAGQLMLAAAAVLMVGYYIIDANRLFSDMHDFGGNGGGVAAWIDDMHLLPLPVNVIGVRLLAGAFIASGAASLAFAKQGDYRRHRSWAIRHVGAGLWVAAQRPFYAVLRLMQAGFMGTTASVTGGAEADAFYYAAYITTLVYFIAAEWLARQPSPVAFSDARGALKRAKPPDGETVGQRSS